MTVEKLVPTFDETNTATFVPLLAFWLELLPSGSKGTCLGCLGKRNNK